MNEQAIKEIDFTQETRNSYPYSDYEEGKVFIYVKRQGRASKLCRHVDDGAE